jgi:PAS domain S-box-containing protein
MHPDLPAGEYNKNRTPYTMEELYRLALDNFPGSVLIIDDEANILYCNDVTEQMLGVTKEWLLSTNMNTVIQLDLAERSAGMEALKEKREVIRYIPNYRGEGMLISSIPVVTPDGRVNAVITYSQDEQYIHNFLAWMDKEKNKLVTALQVVYQGATRYSSVIAESKPMREVIQLALQVAISSATVALYGESGVGKEVIARFIHEKSNRADQIFLPINCSAIPSGLAESEFFGYEGGSFTSASRQGKIGFFEIADKGTLFLDEVGELSLPLQAKLLRVLECGELTRIGGNKVIYVNTRIICATNRDLNEMVREGKFREDLYYRLNIFPIFIPPLRERKEDILPLAKVFLEKNNRKNGTEKVFSPATTRALQTYNWPGNVRELRNIIERMALIIPGDVITGAAFLQNTIPVIKLGNQNWGSELAIGLPLKNAMREMEKLYVEKCYRMCGENVGRTAEMLQVHQSGLYRKLNDFDIK